MLDTYRVFERLSAVMNPEAAKAVTETFVTVLDEVRDTVTKAEFNELQGVVQELAEAQKRTGDRIERLEAVVADLAEAQKRTEARVGELAEAQKRTEARVGELAEAQKRTEARVGELAEAQKRTEAAVLELTRGLTETRQMVGGLSDAVGYGLEDRAIKELPRVLAAEHGVTVKGRLVRRFVRYPGGKKDELNIFGEGERAGESVTVCGEAKARLSRKHVDVLCRLGERLVRSGEAKHPLFLLMVSYSVEPEVEEYAASRVVTVIPSYLL